MRELSTSQSCLLELPTELLCEIARHLAADALLALRLSHPSLNHVVPTPDADALAQIPTCARHAMDRWIAPFQSEQVHRRCFVCKARWPPEMFKSANSPACLPFSSIGNRHRHQILKLPPYFCVWHVGRLTKVIHTAPGGRNEWTSEVSRICRHGGCIQGWSECACDCASCGFSTVRTYTRFLNNEEECKQFRFWRKVVESEGAESTGYGSSRLMVRETCGGKCRSDCRSCIKGKL